MRRSDLAYPARIIPQEDGMVMLTLPDLPGFSLLAVGEQDAFARAPALLEAALACYAAERRPIPTPSAILGAPLVRPRASRGAVRRAA